MRLAITVSSFLMVSANIVSGGDKIDSTVAPRPVPLTRPDMKLYLEDMKERKPRISLPALSDEEKTKLGDREANYENRLRTLYLPNGDARFGPSQPGVRPAAGAPGSFGRDQDPKMTLDYPFKTELFWIVSRTNNCQYCMGHQESKLLTAGLKEDEIAALDGDWSEFTPAQRDAFAFARKITYQPHLITDSDIHTLRKNYTDLQILEMILSTAGNNSINRWKEGVGVPQSAEGGNFGSRVTSGEAPKAEAADHSYLTATSEKFSKSVTRVVPVLLDTQSGQPTQTAASTRPVLENRAEVEKALAIARQRTARLPLVNETEARSILGASWPEDRRLPQWALLLANFPRDGVRNLTTIRNADEKGDLSPLLKAQISWVIARQDRAWYAVGQAKRRLTAFGQSDDQIFALDDDVSKLTETERVLFSVAKKLATSPVVLTDQDVDHAVKLVGNRDTVQLINYITNRAAFDRITEAAGLQIEE